MSEPIIAPCWKCGRAPLVEEDEDEDGFNVGCSSPSCRPRSGDFSFGTWCHGAVDPDHSTRKEAIACWNAMNEREAAKAKLPSRKVTPQEAADWGKAFEAAGELPKERYSVKEQPVTRSILEIERQRAAHAKNAAYHATINEPQPTKETTMTSATTPEKQTIFWRECPACGVGQEPSAKTGDTVRYECSCGWLRDFNRARLAKAAVKAAKKQRKAEAQGLHDWAEDRMAPPQTRKSLIVRARNKVFKYASVYGLVTYLNARWAEHVPAACGWVAENSAKAVGWLLP